MSAKHKYELIIFDWDGTLIDSVPRILHCFRESARTANLPQPEDEAVRELIGLPLGHAFSRLYPSLDEARLPEMYEIYRDHWRDPALPLSPLVSGVFPFLVKLFGQGKQLAIATGKSREGLERELRHYRLEHLFFATRCAQETAPKPEPDMLHEILELVSTPKHRTLYVGDTGLDLAMANRAGIAGVAVLTGGHSQQRLASHQPAFCFEQVTQMTRIFE